jgi:hypothetical protein
MTRTLTIFCLLLLAGCVTQAIGATSLTPPKAVKKSAPVNAKQSFALMQQSHPPRPAYQFSKKVFVWDYPTDSNTTFWVQSNINLLPGAPTNWPVVAIVRTNGYTFTVTNGQRGFFAVRASNSVSNMISGYALTTPSKKRIYQP